MIESMTAAEMDTMAEEASSLLLAMSNPKRLLIMCNLLDGELNVAQLGKRVGLNQSALSQQLSKLRALRLVTTRRDAQQIFYNLASEEVIELLTTLNRLYCSADKLGAKRAC